MAGEEGPAVRVMSRPREVLDLVHGLVRRLGEYQLPDRTPTLRYSFVHTLYQNALYEGLQPSRKVAFSAAVARRSCNTTARRVAA